MAGVCACQKLSSDLRSSYDPSAATTSFVMEIRASVPQEESALLSRGRRRRARDDEKNLIIQGKLPAQFFHRSGGIRVHHKHRAHEFGHLFHLGLFHAAARERRRTDADA